MVGRSDIAPESTRGHAYPDDLAALVAARWEQVEAGQTERPAREGEHHGMPLPPSALARVLSVCYQVSLLSEEARPVTFRLAVSGAEAFAAHLVASPADVEWSSETLKIESSPQGAVAILETGSHTLTLRHKQSGEARSAEITVRKL